MMLLEKARAKVYGSYENLFKSQCPPYSAIEELTFAPSEKFRVSDTASEGEVEKLWKILIGGSTNHRPVMVKTGSTN